MSVVVKYQPKTLASPTGLSQRQQDTALRAIEDVHLAYYGRGGIRDQASKLEKQVNTTAQRIYSLARFASQEAGSPAKAAELFRGMCEFAEAVYKEEHEVTNLRDALPTWSTYKSTILRGIEDVKLSPLEYRTERQFRIAVEEKAERLGLTRPRGPKPVRAIKRFLERTTIRKSLQDPLAQITFDVEAIAHGKTEEAQAILRETLDKLEPLVDPDKLPE